ARTDLVKDLQAVEAEAAVLPGQQLTGLELGEFAGTNECLGRGDRAGRRGALDRGQAGFLNDAALAAHVKEVGNGGGGCHGRRPENGPCEGPVVWVGRNLPLPDT